MGKTINWGILGPGKIASKFAADLKLVEDAKLIAVASRSEKDAKTFARTFDIEHSYGSYYAMLENPFIDVVYIATPHPFHFEHSLLCMNKGKAVLCEKPLAMNTSQVDEMIETAKKNGVFLMEAMWTRFFPAIRKAETLIAEGAIGEIRLLQADFGFFAEFDAQSRLFNNMLGGGSLLDVGVYPLFLATLLLGKPSEIKALSHFSSAEVDLSTSMVMHYPSSATALLTSSIICDTPLTVIISGTKGSIKIGSPWYIPTSLTLQNEKGVSEMSFPLKGTGFYYEAKEVVECLQSHKLESPVFPLALSADIMSTVDRIRKEAGITYKEDN